MEEKLYTVAQVAELFEVKSSTVRTWLKEGILEGIKIGRGHYWRIPASSVKDLATSRWGNESGDV